MYWKSGAKKITLVILTIIFSMGTIMGTISVGYGYWTDRLFLEGNADVKMKINVLDDVLDEESTINEERETPADESEIEPSDEEEGANSFSEAEDIDTNEDRASEAAADPPSAAKEDDQPSAVKEDDQSAGSIEDDSSGDFIN